MRWKKVLVGLIFLVVVAGVGVWVGLRVLEGPAPAGKPTARPAGAGWIDLLDAAHAPHWKNVTDDKDLFEIVDGVLHIYGRMIPPLRYVGYTGDVFGDFDLHIEYKVSWRANSGIFLRAPVGESSLRGFEVQVLDDYGKPPNKNRSGSIYDVVTPMFNMSRPAGEWNSYDIRVRGLEVIVVMNGWMVVHTDFSKMTMPLGKFDAPYAQMPREGEFRLQDHGGEVWYRNILIRKVKEGDSGPAPSPVVDLVDGGDGNSR